MPRGVLRITLASSVEAEAAQRAVACGLPLSRWAAQVIEAFVAGERCRHGGVAPVGAGVVTSIVIQERVVSRPADDREGVTSRP